MKHKNEKGIISLIAVLSIGTFALGTSLVLAKGVLQQMTINRNNVSTYQAFYAAETGAAEGAYQFMNAPDDTPYTGGSLASLINGSQVDIEVTVNPFSEAIILGKSSKNDNFRRVFYEAVKYPDGPAFSYGIYTPSLVNLNGSSITVNGNIFATGGVDQSGHPNLNGEIVVGFPAYPPVFIPQPYINAANTNDSCFTTAACSNSRALPNSYFNNPVSGVIFITGDMTGSKKISDAVITGSLWVVGDLELNNCLVSSSGSYLAVVSEGRLTLSGNTNIKGVVYAYGEVTVNGGGHETVNIDGTLISKSGISDITINGGLRVDYNDDLNDMWNQLAGLQKNCNGTCPAVINNWNEE